jgi:2-C-methyl-D-erythritol 4-phosphate cytidylyltransferase
VRDTVKRTAGGVITGTPERASLTAIQTPQVFQADLIKAALTNAMRKHLAITDDCSAVEQLRVKPVVTQGSDENLKITTPIDIELAESILRRRGGA